MNLISKCIRFIPYHLYKAKSLSRKVVECKLLKYYSDKSENTTSVTNENSTTLIFMVDGRMIHGGLSDRLRGMISIYKYAKEHNYDFKIYHRYPFALEDFYIPSKIDWRIQNQDLKYNLKEAQPVFVESLGYLFENYTINKVLDDQIKADGRQYHIYTNVDLAGKQFNKYFNELFTESPYLHASVINLQGMLPHKYNAMVFRFQQLLGDFSEGHYPTLSKKEQIALIKKCINKVKDIQSKQKDKLPFLITSDSSTFLNEVVKLPNVYIIPGKVVHMDYSISEKENVYLKSFLDLTLLSHAQSVYLLKTGKMYKSGFALRAALIGNSLYKEISF